MKLWYNDFKYKFGGEIVDFALFIASSSILVILIAIAAALIINEIKQGPAKTPNKDLKRMAGSYGEKQAISKIKKILCNEDYLFTNIEFSYEDRPAELDCVIINKYGVFIIEVKNYVGFITGNEDDYEWQKFKITDSGNVYECSVKNPIKQVKRQVYLLSGYLRSCGINVWIKGYALLINRNSPVNSNYILSTIDDIDKAVHTKDRIILSKDTVEHIKALLE